VIRIRKPHELTDGFSRIVRAEARSIRNHLENLAFTEAASGTPIREGSYCRSARY
jgi:hypothetical protein